MSRSKIVRSYGSCSNENFGRSSRKNGENPFRRMREVSMAMFVNHGLVDPKITRNVSSRRSNSLILLYPESSGMKITYEDIRSRLVCLFKH